MLKVGTALGLAVIVHYAFLSVFCHIHSPCLKLSTDSDAL